MSVRTLAIRSCMAAAVLGMLATRARGQEGGPPGPTEEHKVLATEVGTWDAEIKSYFGGPGADPMASKGTETNEMMTGGLWLVSKFEGDFGGTKFEGRGQFGYDPVKKKYVGTWVDSMSPHLSTLEGTYDAKAKTMTYTGEAIEPGSKAKYSQKMVTVTKDDGSRAFTLYMKSDQTGGQEVKVMEVAYTKRK